ncbi:MAG: DUF1553 domain-containing protein [Planctomycetota bacterium]|nr:DUF1553 domain-containing protein [Planctomycetota bacterium]
MQAIASSLLFCFWGTDAYSAEPIDFERQIRPLLQERCGRCHGNKQQKSGLRIDARHAAFVGGDGGPVIVPGKSAESELFRRVVTEDFDERMPPEGPPLTLTETDLLRRWIDLGANWPESNYDREAARDRRLEHWSFQPLGNALTQLPDETRGRNVAASARELDRFVQLRLAENNLTPAPAADRRTLIRRLYFVMIGLPPPPEVVARFVTDDDPAAFEQLVEKLLHSPRYGERWAQHWLDIVRYADTHGFEVNTPRDNAWPYRDYVIQAFNDDKPYDQFVREQLAGDALDADAATGFLVAAAVLLPGQIGKDAESIRLARQDALDEMIVGTSATFLGLTIGCARCHDHKFDPITARDYYSLQAFFAGVTYGDRPLRDAATREAIARVATLDQQIEELTLQLRKFDPQAYVGRTLVIDEEDQERVTILKTPNGTGTNPLGTQRGYLNDTGAADRVGNLSRGRYTWWPNTPGVDVLSYNPGVAGTFRLWLSWGAHGSGVHTRDARYILDEDGDLTTTADQRELASVDQYYLAGVTEGETEKKPLWSGLFPAGLVTLTNTSKLIVRGGDTGTGITADVIVLQEIDSTNEFTPERDSTTDPARSGTRLPRLRDPLDSLANVERFAARPTRFLRFTTLETIDNNKHEPCIDELEVFTVDTPTRNVALASTGTIATSSGNYSTTGKHQLQHVNDGRYSNDRSWISNEHGGGWVQLEFPSTVSIDRVVWGRDRTGKFLDRLPTKYRIEISIDGTNWTLAAGHEDRVPLGTPHDPVQTLVRNASPDSTSDISAMVSQVEQLRQKKDQLGTTRTVYGGRFGTPEKTFVLRRGDPEQRLEEIASAVPALFSTVPLRQDASEQQRRLALAEWISSSDNPLTARVIVNRIWQYHFGNGLVETPSDFGLNGARPSHPELLDWLASDFIQSGWSIKRLHRVILLSHTWQQSSLVNPQAETIDRDNKWLWHYQSRRLEGEAIRDSMLAVSGELNLKSGGPGFNFFKTRGGLSGFPEVEEFSPEEMRRMVYAHKIRMEKVPVFGAFDCPDAGQATPQRTQSTTAIQALNLFNSPFVTQRAEKLTARLQREFPTSPQRQIEAAFQLAYGRQPSDLELSASSGVAKEHGLATICRVLFNSSEFLFIP